MKNKYFNFFLFYLCFFWMCISLFFFKTYDFLYYLNLIINPIGMILLIFFNTNNKYNKKLKSLISFYFFIYGTLFLLYDIYNILNEKQDLESFYFLSDFTMIITPFKVYTNEIKIYFKKNR